MKKYEDKCFKYVKKCLVGVWGHHNSLWHDRYYSIYFSTEHEYQNTNSKIQNQKSKIQNTKYKNNPNNKNNKNKKSERQVDNTNNGWRLPNKRVERKY